MKLLSLPAAALLLLTGLMPVAAAAAPSVSVTGPGLYGARWDPCAAITFHTDQAGGYAGSTREIASAFERLGNATGLRFRAVRSGADITLDWATPRQVHALSGRTVGVMSTMSIAHDGVEETVSGSIHLDRTGHLRRGFPTSGDPSWGQVYLHEIAHVLGLSHVENRTLLMYPTLSRSNHRLGAADRSRLHRVGSAAGCIEDSAR